jgi:hypothetical protein
MINDVDYIISLMKEYTPKENEGEIGEQDAPVSDTSGSGERPDYPTVTKYDSKVARTGPANQIGLTKWADIVKLNRGPANTLL